MPRPRPVPVSLSVSLALAGLVSGLVAATTVPATAAPLAAPKSLSVLGEKAEGLPVLSWGLVGGAEEYEVQIDDNDDFTSPSFDVETENRYAAPTEYLGAGEHFWRVRATTRDAVSSWSSGSFEVEPPAAPTPTPFADDVLDQPEQPPVLRWSPVGGAISYVVQLDDEGTFSGAEEFPTKSTALVVPRALEPKDYLWRVKAVRRAGVESPYSAAETFSIVGLRTPQIISPDSSSTNNVTDVVLDWAPVPGARYYEIQVSTDDDFPDSAVIDNRTKITGTKYSPPITYPNNQYYWRVRAVDAAGAKSAWTTSLSQFRRQWTERPTPLFPLTGTGPLVDTKDPFYFQWSAVPHATRYELQIGTDSGFSPGTFDSCLTAQTTWTPFPMKLNTVTGKLGRADCKPDPPIRQGEIQYWRVRALDLPFESGNNTVDGVPGLFSDPQVFVYNPDRAPETGEVPGQMSPTNGATVTVPTLRWSDEWDATTFEVAIFDKTGNRVLRTDTFAHSYTPEDRLDPADGPFEWALTAFKADGTTASVTYRHTFNLAPESAPSTAPLTATAGTGTTVGVPELAWQPHPQADAYRVTVFRPNGSGGRTLIAWAFQNRPLENPAITSTDAVFLVAGDYSWEVTALDDDGVPIATGPVAQFHIANLPAVDGLRLSLDGDTAVAGDGCAFDLDTSDPSPTEPDICTEIPSTPVLSWNPVDGASFYAIYVSEDDKFTNTLEPLTALPATSQTVWTPNLNYVHPTIPDSQAGASYYWFVRPCKSSTVCGPDPVSVPVSLSNHAFRKRSPQVTGGEATQPPGSLTEVTLSWDEYADTMADTTFAVTGEAAAQGVWQYRVQIDDADTFATPLETVVVDQTTYTSFAKLYADGPLYWRVQVIDSDENNLPWSQTYSIDKRSPLPALVSPVDNETVPGSSVVLQWEPQAFLQYYEVEVYRNDDTTFSSGNLVLRERAAYSAYVGEVPVPASPSPYVWRVRRIDSTGNAGPWSVARRFTVQTAATTLVAPADGTRVAPRSALLYWNLIDKASRYRVEMTLDGRAQRPFVTASNAYAPDGDLDSGTYRWRVVTLDSDGEPLGVSAWRTFTVDADAPEIIKIAPTDNVKPRRPAFTITFSEKVTGVSKSSIRLVPRGGTKAIKAKVTTSAGGSKAKLQILKNLKRGAYYEILVTSAIKDTSGNPLRTDDYTIDVRR